MRKSLISNLFLILPFIFSTVIFSCSSTKKVKYFQDIPDSGQVKNLPKVVYTPLIVQAGDILHITIQTIDPMSSAGLIAGGNLISSGTSSMPSTSSGGGAAGALAALAGAGSAPQQPTLGYLVDKDGNVEFPVLGKIKAAGYTTSQLKDLIYAKASKFYKDAVVTVRYANFKVNVTGEVLKPGQYILPDEKESIMDVLAIAGDLTIFGKRENVLLVRENPDGTKTAYRINLKKSEALSSSLYYVHQNDLIYVEPRKAKSDANDAAQVRYYGIAAAVTSVLIILATRAK